MAFSFFGGVHPKENKFYTCDKQTEVFPEPDVIVIPMSQNIGAPCMPLVKKGDPVTVGQKIGDNQGLCAPIHSSVSGTVKAVEMRPHNTGTNVMSVVIQNDHLDTLCETVKPRTQEEVDALTPMELVDIIHEGGLVGMGGATFPTHVKLSGGIGKVDTVIIRGSQETVNAALAAVNPIFFDLVPLTLEEVFVYELGGVDYEVKNVIL